MHEKIPNIIVTPIDLHNVQGRNSENGNGTYINSKTYIHNYLTPGK